MVRSGYPIRGSRTTQRQMISGPFEVSQSQELKNGKMSIMKSLVVDPTGQVYGTGSEVLYGCRNFCCTHKI
jgi:hypothetical protein